MCWTSVKCKYACVNAVRLSLLSLASLEEIRTYLPFQAARIERGSSTPSPFVCREDIQIVLAVVEFGSLR